MVLEGNKDEADRCIDIAIKALHDGKLDKSLKFLRKAESLYPSNRAKELLKKVESIPENNRRNQSPDSRSEGLRNRQTTDSKPAEAEYTVEQLEAVKRIKRCKDYYEVLLVTKEATDSDIKKSYKKMALQLHPDKNKAPGSVEAFKAIGNAVAILTDVEKRKSYDLYGNDEPFNPHGGGGSSATGLGRRQNSEFAYTRGFESDVTAEELFNMFFGGIPQQNVYMRQRRFNRAEQHRERDPQSNYAGLINLLPILLLIGLSMMSSFFISDPIYSLQPSHKYSVQRRTQTLKVPYYVKDDFHTEYQGSVSRLETSVEEDYINHLRQSCLRERNYRDAMLSKARTFGDRDLYRKAQNINTPSCDNLQKYLAT